MIERETRVNGEYYVCPVFNEAVEAGRRIRTHHIEQMWGHYLRFKAPRVRAA